MFLPAILYGVAGRRRTARLVAVHGMDDPARGLEMADQYENAARIALDRVGADYALTVPFAFAFYGDLWQAHRAGAPAGDLPAGLERLGPFAPLYPVDVPALSRRTELEVALALELLANARLPLPGSPPGISSAYRTLAGVLADLQRYEPDARAWGALWHFATGLATYLTAPALKEALLARAAREIEASREEVILLAHGVGSLICYELLLRRPELPVRCLVTLGSPLGMHSVRASLVDALGEETECDDDAGLVLPFPAALPRWINLRNGADMVASRYLLAPLYRPPSASDARHVHDVDTGKSRPPTPTTLFAGHHPATYLSSKVAGMVLRSIVEQ
jgi:hypothetical protein